MKLKKSLPGPLWTTISDFWKEYKLILAFLVVALCLLLAAVIGFGQTRPAHQGATKIPKGIIRPVVNWDKGTSLKLSDFNHKLLILDFWATYCGPCRELLPRYDSLQQQMGGKLQILLVTHEKEQAALNFLKQHHYNLPSVTNDIDLARAFPHNAIPFEVWLYQGKVIATTDGDAVNREQVENILDHQTQEENGKNSPAAKIPQKIMALFDEDQPLLVNGNGWRTIAQRRTCTTPTNDSETSASILYQSLITPYNPRLNSIAGIHRTAQHVNVFALNATPLSLYHFAAAQTDPLLDLSNRYLVELPDSLRDRAGANLTGIAKKSWLEKYALCYNLCLPPNFKGDLGNYLLGDLNRFFGNCYGIEAAVEQRNIACLILRKLPDSPASPEHPADQAGNGQTRSRNHRAPGKTAPEYRSDSTGTVISGLPLSELVLRLAYTYRKLPTPVIDETGLEAPVDIHLEGNIADRRQLDKALRKNGLELVEATRSIPMVVIRRAAEKAIPLASGTPASSTHLQTLTPNP